MPAVQLTRNFKADGQPLENPLPHLLHTPLGIAIIEIQGTIHAPNMDQAPVEDDTQDDRQMLVVGRLEFPHYNGSEAEGPWMKRVYLYIGKHQRLTGEIKKLPKPLVVLSKKSMETQPSDEDQADRLSIDAVVKHKILFSSRPEPVGTC